MSDHRRSRGAALTVAALAVPGLVLMGAASATAAETFDNDTLPGKVYLAEGGSATVNLTTPDGFACQDWFGRLVGQKRAKVTVSPPSVPTDCNGPVTFTVSVDQGYKKKANVVVKFKVYNTDGTAKMVETLVVKVNKVDPSATASSATKPDKPAKPAKGGSR